MSPADDDWFPPVAILAGGLATRLGPLAQGMPKVLLDVAGAPFVLHQLRLLQRRGFDRAVLCVGHLGEQVKAALGPDPVPGLSIAYTFDGPQLLGTGGALRRALPLLGPVFGVLYGDAYLDFDYGAAVRAFDRSTKRALMVVYRNEGRWDTSNTVYRDGIVVRYDKRDRTPDMHHIDYGFGILAAATIEKMRADAPCDLADVYRDLAAHAELAGFEVHDRFYEIGSTAGLAETRAHFALIAHARARPAEGAATDPRCLGDFDQHADDYAATVGRALLPGAGAAEFYTARRAQIIRRILATRPRPQARVLDLGCGDGLLVRLLAEDPALAVYGCDPHVEMARVAAGGSKRTLAADGTSLPFRDGTFDLVALACVLHHVPLNRRLRLLTEVRRVLRPDGVCFVFEHNPLNPLTQWIVSRCPFDEDAVLLSRGHAMALLREAGLDVRLARYTSFFPERLAWLVPLESGLGWLPLGMQYYITASKPGGGHP